MEGSSSGGSDAFADVDVSEADMNLIIDLEERVEAACAAGDFAKAREYQDRLAPLHDALFCETSPAPVKYAASLLGLCSEDVRLPLAEASEGARTQVKAAMQHAGLIK